MSLRHPPAGVWSCEFVFPSLCVYSISSTVFSYGFFRTFVAPPMALGFPLPGYSGPTRTPVASCGIGYGLRSVFNNRYSGSVESNSARDFSRSESLGLEKLARQSRPFNGRVCNRLPAI